MILLTLSLITNYATFTKTLYCIAFTNIGLCFDKHCLHQTASYDITTGTSLVTYLFSYAIRYNGDHGWGEGYHQ